MKIVKLRKNQKLYKQGFTHAFRFRERWDQDDREYGKIIASLERIYDNRRWRGKYYAWEVVFNWTPDDVDTRNHDITIAVRDESVTTQVMLIKDTILDTL